MSRKEITGAEEMMRIAVNGEKNVDSLLGYYRDQIDDFNQERAQWAIHYQYCKNNASDRHILQSQLLKTNDRLSDLESVLALKKSYLTNQRQKYFKTLQDGQKIKQSLQSTRQELRELTNQCKPIQLQNQKISTFRDNSSLGKDKKNNPLTTQLQLQLININKHHEAKKQTLLKQVGVLKQELAELTEEHQDRDFKGRQAYIDALNNLANLEKKHMDLTSEFFRFRMDNNHQQRRIQEESEITRLRNMALVQRLKNLQESHSKQFQAVDQQVKKNNAQFKKKYDDELKKKQQHLSLLKDQYQRIQDMHLNKIKALEQELQTTNARLKGTEQKSRVEVSSLKSQIKILKGRLAKDGVHQMRSQLAAENQDVDNQQSEDSLEASALDQINREVRELEERLKLN